MVVGGSIRAMASVTWPLTRRRCGGWVCGVAASSKPRRPRTPNGDIRAALPRTHPFGGDLSRWFSRYFHAHRDNQRKNGTLPLRAGRDGVKLLEELGHSEVKCGRSRLGE